VPGKPGHGPAERVLLATADPVFAALCKQAAEVAGIVAAVGDEAPEPAGCGDQRGGETDIVGIAAAEQQHAGTAAIVGQPVQFGGSPAARATYRLGEVPPFAPAAERWALTCVASIETEL